MNQPDGVYLMGYGNPGRLDDGLGPAFIEALEQTPLPDDVTVDSDYQLTVEDAKTVAEHKVTIFIDASVQGREPFFFRKISPRLALSFSSHSVDPENLLALATELFDASPECFALGIRGYEFNEFGETLSAAAQKNLAAALQFLRPLIKTRRFGNAITDEDVNNDKQSN